MTTFVAILTIAQPTFPVFSPRSPYARSIDTLSHGVLWAMLGILLLVVALVSYTVHKYRARPGEQPPTPTYGNVKLEIGYTVSFVVILGVILFYSLRVMQASDPATNQPNNLLIVAHQFWWEVHYPNTGIVTANEIHIPVNEPQRVGFRSADVIHDFWVPQLGRKIDVIPGVENRTWFSADTPGTYEGRCAEYCGQEHAWMRIRVIAQTSENFARWEKAQLTLPTNPPGSSVAAAGAAMFQQLSCASCHEIQGTAARARVGPDLTHVASRETLAAGRLENSPQTLADWLHEPDVIKPGSKMPNLHLTTEQQVALVAYLETLR